MKWNEHIIEYLFATCCRLIILTNDYILWVTKGKSFPQETHKADKKRAFKKQMREAETFADLTSQLEEMIAWCKTHKMKKEKRLLNLLRLKCRRMKCLEAEGYK